MIKWEELSPEDRRQCIHGGLVPEYKKKRTGTPGVFRSIPNRTERRFYSLLDMLKYSKRIENWKRPDTPFRLAARTSYLPDATVFTLDGKIDVIEIKGTFEYDDGCRTKIKIAAELYREHRFWFVKRTKDSWEWYTVTAEHGIRKRKLGPDWF